MEEQNRRIEKLLIDEPIFRELQPHLFFNQWDAELINDWIVYGRMLNDSKDELKLKDTVINYQGDSIYNQGNQPDNDIIDYWFDGKLGLWIGGLPESYKKYKDTAKGVVWLMKFQLHYFDQREEQKKKYKTEQRINNTLTKKYADILMTRVNQYIDSKEKAKKEIQDAIEFREKLKLISPEELANLMKISDKINGTKN